MALISTSRWLKNTSSGATFISFQNIHYVGFQKKYIKQWHLFLKNTRRKIKNSSHPLFSLPPLTKPHLSYQTHLFWGHKGRDEKTEHSNMLLLGNFFFTTNSTYPPAYPPRHSSVILSCFPFLFQREGNKESLILSCLPILFCMRGNNYQQEGEKES
jgi:hypothetical protein